MFGLETPEAMMALAKVRHEAALQDAETYRRLPRRPSTAANQVRDYLGDWLIDVGQRIKTSAVAPKTQRNFVQPHHS